MTSTSGISSKVLFGLKQIGFTQLIFAAVCYLSTMALATGPVSMGTAMKRLPIQDVVLRLSPK